MKASWIECFIFAVFCCAAIITGLVFYKSATTDSTKECMRSILDVKACTSNCYSKDACAQILQAARDAASIREALRTEIRYLRSPNGTQLQNASFYSTGDKPTANFCQLTRSEWDLKLSKLNSAINGTLGCYNCNLKLRSDTPTCSDLIWLIKCAFTRILVSYGSQKFCLNSETYEACNSAAEYSIQELSELDLFYESVLPDRKSVWDDIKSRMTDLAKNLLSLNNSYECPKGIICSSELAVSFNGENINTLNDPGRGPDLPDYEVEANDY